jgi:hypothetical protein
MGKPLLEREKPLLKREKQLLEREREIEEQTRSKLVKFADPIKDRRRWPWWRLWERWLKKCPNRRRKWATAQGEPQTTNEM